MSRSYRPRPMVHLLSKDFMSGYLKANSGELRFMAFSNNSERPRRDVAMMVGVLNRSANELNTTSAYGSSNSHNF
jgi:hypothetical protein